MSWLFSILTGLVCSILAGTCGLLISAKCVEWYNISSREGASGYFVAAITLLSALVALVIGIIAARIAVACGHPAWWQQFSAGLAPVLAAAVIALCITRFSADIPPTLDGKALEVEVELRWPDSQSERPACPPDQSWIRLGSINTRTRMLRAEEPGSLDAAGPQSLDGRWVIRGRVPLFTERGDRILRLKLGELQEGFQVPIPARPGANLREWSEWLPRPRPDGQPPINTLTFRFRLVAAQD